MITKILLTCFLKEERVAYTAKVRTMFLKLKMKQYELMSGILRLGGISFGGKVWKKR